MTNEIYIPTEEELDMLREFGDNHRWISDNIDNLRKCYINQFVAVKDKMLIGHDHNPTRLIDRIRRRYEVKNRYGKVGLGPVALQFIDDGKTIYAL